GRVDGVHSNIGCNIVLLECILEWTLLAHDAAQELLNDKEYLSCIPPTIDYPPDASTSTRSTRNGGLWPSRIMLWNGFLEEV
ncbi:8599_t:CDS:2, partial [Paraglomus occultum]